MYNIGWWDKMRLSVVRPIKKYTKIGDDFIFNKYAGYPIESKFKSIADDEGNGSNAVTLQSYMYKSSNYYNSLLAYIGSFRESDLSQDGFLKSSGSKDGKTLFYNVSLPNEPVRKRNQSEESFEKEMRNMPSSMSRPSLVYRKAAEKPCLSTSSLHLIWLLILKRCFLKD
jgi:hypothetical protein